MSTLVIAAVVLLALLVLLLAGGVWIAIALRRGRLVRAAVLHLHARPTVNLFQSFWGSNASWTLAALPLFVWMGEILYRTKLSDEMFEGLSPWLRLAARAADARERPRLRHLRQRCRAPPRPPARPSPRWRCRNCKRRGYDEKMCLGSLCGAGTLGLLLPPSIIMVVYAVAAEVSILKVFIAGVLPGILLMALFSGYIIVWALLNPDKTPQETERDPVRREALRRAAT